MRLLLAFAVALLVISPAFAQRGGVHSGGHMSAPHISAPHTTAMARPHTINRASVAHHFNGRSFDHPYFTANFGRDHRFGFCRPFFYGSFYRFAYGGFWFGYDDPWPWDDASYYIDDDGGVYYIYSPYHPGWRQHIWVIVN